MPTFLIYFIHLYFLLFNHHTIEEATKQKNSESHKLMVNNLYTYSWVKRIHQRFFKSYGITAQQYNVLRILRV